MTPTEPAPILVLAGTGEARELAWELTTRGQSVVMSFAGRTSPRELLPPSIQQRIGGFGGVQGLVAELQGRGYQLLIDATHPFAIRMAQNAVVAARIVGVPHVRLLRPPWRPLPGAIWYEVDSLEQAAKQLDGLGARRAFLAIGSTHMAAFAHVSKVDLVLRSIESPSPLLDSATVLLARGPFTYDDELALLREHRIDVLVARNSGGQAMEPKLKAAHRLGLPTIMIRRPKQPAGPKAATVEETISWVEATLPVVRSA